MNIGRTRTHKQVSVRGNAVLYVMSRDQRISDNYGLAFAQKLAVEKSLPLAVVFVLSKKGHRSREHYRFMLDGLVEVEQSLEAHSIPFMLLIGDPLQALSNLFHHTTPSAVVMDFSPLKGPQKLIQELKRSSDIDLYEVDSHNIVPVWVASEKQEVGARTLRPKIHKKLHEFLGDICPLLVKHPKIWPGKVLRLSELTSQIDNFLNSIPENNQKLLFKSGESAAHSKLNDFILHRLEGYAEQRNRPDLDGTSGLSSYLHYGQIASLAVVRALRELLVTRPELAGDVDCIIEEMVVRKELSDNYCYYAQGYRRVEHAPNWAQSTLKKHESDIREFLYSKEDFEKAQTHDPGWNAAQTQLIKSGIMHGYMRMYWAKKVLEWSSSPQEAIDTLIYLNDHYSIDGGDPNGYTGIMWSVCGVHDRPWGERQVYGSIRCMVYSGLKRKFPIEDYVKQWITK